MGMYYSLKATFHQVGLRGNEKEPLPMNDERFEYPEKLLTDYLSTFEFQNKSVIHEMILSLVELAKQNFDVSDINIIKQSIYELRKSYKVFARYRDTRKVSVFGSARCPESNLNYQLTLETVRAITELGYMIITGAGNGIMEAGNRGAVMNRDFGVNIELPFEQEPNEYIRDSNKLVSFKYFFNRKLIFVKESDAALFFPGGFGTHDEAFELLTLIQTGRCAPRPLIFMNYDDSEYWQRWFSFVEHELLGKEYISSGDMHMIEIYSDPKECVKSIQEFYKVYHSIRYHENLAVIRLNHALDSSQFMTIRDTYEGAFFRSFR